MLLKAKWLKTRNLEVGDSYVGICVRNRATQTLVQGQIVMLRFDCGAVSRASKRFTKELLLLSSKR